ncbi:MAG: GrpB family protein [Thermaerobacter sp.]|nr:GrpB family protein [Thermaerobacter sp.]
MRVVEVVPYQTNWPNAFWREAQALRGIFNDHLVSVHHIGSTAVPGLSAKPVIDMMPVVDDIRLVATVEPQLEALGYASLGEYGISGRRFFRKGGDNPTHHLHCYQQANPEIDRHLAFRDYLRTHPRDAHAYQELKLHLARQHRYDIDAYIEGKDDFVKSLEARALSWWRKCR